MQTTNHFNLKPIWCFIIASIVMVLVKSSQFSRAKQQNELWKLEYELMDSTYNISAVVEVDDTEFESLDEESDDYTVKIKRNNRTFYLWKDDKDRSTNAIVITVPGAHVDGCKIFNEPRLIRRTINVAEMLNKMKSAFSVDFSTRNWHEIVIRYDSIWVNGFITWGLYLYDDVDDAWPLPIVSATTSSLRIKVANDVPMTNFSVKLVTSQILNRTLADGTTEAPTSSPTQSSSPLISQVTESTIPMSFKILIGVLIIFFVFLLLMLCFNKHVRTRLLSFCTACCCQKKFQDLTHDTVTITMHEMKNREN